MEELFTEALASIAELAERWNVTIHQLSYAARSRKIPHEKMIGTSRLFNAEQQKMLYAIFHKHLTDDAPVDGFHIVVPELYEQEHTEHTTLEQRVDAVEKENADLKADLVILKRLLADFLERK